MDDIRHHLDLARLWSREKIRQGSEPPWSWYQHMKLIEAIDALLEQMEETSPSASERPVLSVVRLTTPKP